MKKLSFLLSLIIAFASLTSCSQDDEVNKPSIFGVWRLTAWKVVEPVDLNNDGVSSTNLLKEFGCLSGSELIFKDSKHATLFYSSEVAFNVETENESQFFMLTCGTSSDFVPREIFYVQQENSIILNDNGEELVLTRSENTLSIFVLNGFVARDVNTQAIVVSQDVTYVFTKQ